MKTPRIIILSGLALLISVSATRCTPDDRAPAPIPRSGFEVNLTSTAYLSVDTVIDVDGDSIAFILQSTVFFGIIHGVYITTNKPGYEYLSVEEYPYNINTEMRDSSGIQRNSYTNVLDSGVLLNDGYNTHSWISFSYRGNTNVFPGGEYGYYSLMYNFSVDGAGWLYDGLTFNKDQYIVFRKLKGTVYQFYWVKVRNEGTIQMNSTIKILNGKYQLNSIVTGQ